MSCKRNAFWLAAAVTAGSLVSLYIRNKRRTASLPLYNGERGSIHVSVASLERIVVQSLCEERNVRPVRIRAYITGPSVNITGTVELKKGHFTPSMQQIEQSIRTKLLNWAGIELPSTALRLETIMK